MGLMSFKAAAAAAVCSCLLFTGCAATGSSSTKNYDGVDPSLTQDDANFFSESGWTACAIGAAAGAAACMFLTDNDTRTQCLLLAVPAGCGVFMGGNYLLDELRVNYKTKEAQLDHMSELVEQDNTKLRNLNNNARNLLESDKAELARLERAVADGDVSADSLSTHLSEMDKNIDYLRDSIAVAQQRLDQYKQTRGQLLLTDNGRQQAVLTAAQRQELAKLDEQIAELEETIQQALDTQLAYSQARSSLQASGAA